MKQRWLNYRRKYTYLGLNELNVYLRLSELQRVTIEFKILSSMNDDYDIREYLYFGWFVSTAQVWVFRPRLRLATLRPRQNGRHFADDILKCIFFNENARISLKISLEFVPKFRINNIPALVQIMAWRRSGDKPLSEPMMVSLLTHICVTRPQWVLSRDFYSHMWWYKSVGDLTIYILCV